MSGITDPIADMLTRIRNSIRAGHLKVDVPSSKMKVSIAKIMKDEGFMRNYKVVDTTNKQKMLRIYLKYQETNESAIYDLQRISKPGRRKYVKAEDLKPVYNNIGIWILSTSKGVITNKTAKTLNIGGEIICEIL
jgi:small subunit ribosomal protein S8